VESLSSSSEMRVRNYSRDGRREGDSPLWAAGDMLVTTLGSIFQEVRVKPCAEMLALAPERGHSSLVGARF